MGGKSNAACVLLILLVFSYLSFAERINVSVQVPVKEVTIYSNNMAFAIRSATINLGTGDFSLLLKNFTASAVMESVSASDDKGEIENIISYQLNTTKLETKYLSFEEILNKTVGSSVRVLTKNGLKNGSLVWFASDKLGIRSEKGITIISIADIEEFETPLATYTKLEEVSEKEQGLRIDEKSSMGSHSILINYLVPDANWEANYKYYFNSDEKSGSGTLQGWAKISNNVGEDWENIKLSIVVGYPHMLSYLIPQPIQKLYAAEALGAGAPSVVTDFISAFLGEYYVYTLKEPVTLADGDTKYLPLFDKAVNFAREYVWDTNWERPHKVYKLSNNQDESWASGIARVYLKGSFIGEDRISYIAKGKEAEVTVADVPDLVVKKETNSTTGKEYSNARTTTYSVILTIENRKDEDAELVVRDRMVSGDTVSLVSSNPPATRKADNLLEWKVTIQKGQKKEIIYTYTVTNYYYYY